MSEQNTSPTIGFRLKVFFELLAGLRRHDFRSARTFMQMQSPGKSLPKRLGRFVGWALHQMWCEIPDTMRRVSFADRVSKVPCWLEEPNPFENHPWRDQPDAVLPESADTVVIGCGLAGSAMAYFWGKKAPADRKLVVVEMHEAASGSAGRNEGLVVMGRYYNLVHTTVMRYLNAARRDLAPDQRDRMAHRFAAAYCKGCYRNGDLVEKTVREEGFDCDYARQGWVQAREANDQEGLAKSVQMALDTGYTDWTSITPEKVRELTGMNVRHNAGFSIAAATFHPARWCWYLLRSALDGGKVAFYSHTRAREVEDAGEHYLVHTERGTIRARHVVNCTESYTPLLHRQFHGIVRPTQTQAAIGDGGPAGIKPHMGISNSRAFFGKHGSKVMVGSDATRVPDHEAGRVQPSRFLTKYLCGEMENAYGASQYHVTNEWSGTVAYTPDEYPIVGLIDGKRQYIIGGMAGSGTAVGFNGARCITNRILGRTDEPDDFPEPCFSPTRFLDPENHPWPETDDSNARD